MVGVGWGSKIMRVAETETISYNKYYIKSFFLFLFFLILFFLSFFLFLFWADVLNISYAYIMYNC